MINPIDYESFSTNVNCYGGSDGQIGFVDKGLAPYTFYIDGVQNLDPLLMIVFLLALEKEPML